MADLSSEGAGADKGTPLILNRRVVQVRGRGTGVDRFAKHVRTVLRHIPDVTRPARCPAR